MRYDAEGKAHRYWGPLRMPRWPDHLSDCTIFLYPSLEAARAGEDNGGSGFLLGVPWESNPQRHHVYAVSNYHVSKGGGFSVVRLNTKSGGTTYIETEPHEWFHDHGRDLAIYRIDDTDLAEADYKYSSFPEIELSQETWDAYRLGIGDEVVSVGRFFDLSGVQRNEPLLRTGVLASGSILPVGQARGMSWDKEPSYVIEMRSRTGFSGSPVYIYIEWHTSRMVDVDIAEGKTAYELFKGPWLLGVQWGQMPIKGPDAIDPAGASASMLAVVPCFALSKLLMENDDVLQERREREKKSNERVEAVAESVPSTTDENPQHREDFNSLLDAAARGKRPNDQT